MPTSNKYLGSSEIIHSEVPWHFYRPSQHDMLSNCCNSIIHRQLLPQFMANTTCGWPRLVIITSHHIIPSPNSLHIFTHPQLNSHYPSFPWPWPFCAKNCRVIVTSTLRTVFGILLASLKVTTVFGARIEIKRVYYMGALKKEKKKEYTVESLQQAS